MRQFLLWLLISTAGLLGSVYASPALAGPPPFQDGDAACLACHKRPNLVDDLPSGEVWSLHIDPLAYQASIHTQEGITCNDCHPQISDYPHPPRTITSRRFYQLEQYQSCRECHQDIYEAALDSIHATELASGNWEAAICTDCHGAHDTTPANEPRPKIPQTCSRCHSGINNEYVDSVHGAALIDEANTDVPTCIDCHGVHHQEDPRTASFRLHSPELCARCHADPALMEKYDISTHVFETYVADFHGTTVTLFERRSPDLPTNKAVCYDCHGVHNMKKADDPQSQVIRENLLQTCQKCHPEATENFSASWLSHYEPDLQKHPIVYLVDLFYKIMIPAVLGFMGVFVIADLGSRLIHRYLGKGSHH
jgi:predicted CXXCH cytochrome family protein